MHYKCKLSCRRSTTAMISTTVSVVIELGGGRSSSHRKRRQVLRAEEHCARSAAKGIPEHSATVPCSTIGSWSSPELLKRRLSGGTASQIRSGKLCTRAGVTHVHDI